MGLRLGRKGVHRTRTRRKGCGWDDLSLGTKAVSSSNFREEMKGGDPERSEVVRLRIRTRGSRE